MQMESSESVETKPNPTKEKGQRKKPYRSPQLEHLGDVRSVTLGATVWTDDESGDPGGPYLPRP